jgi:hypothetical protein
MDPYIDILFNRLNRWRHLPAYRLEPRADVFFIAFLTEILESELKIKVREPIIPEFPFRKGTIYGEEVRGPNASVKVDFLVLSEDGNQVFFVELKTDQASFRPEQDEYLNLATEKKFSALVRGVLEIVEATNVEYLPKYMHLLALLERLGMIRYPDDLPAKVCVKEPPTAISWLDEIELLPEADVPKPNKVYIIPESKPGCTCISFEQVAKVVAEIDSPMARAFAQNLGLWISKAGSIHPGELDG